MPLACRKYASVWRWMIVLHPLWLAAGRIQADRVMAEPRLSEAALATLTRFPVPLKLSALPWRPAVVHVAPVIVPTFPLPDASATIAPLPSPNAQAPTSPGGVDGAELVVASADR